MFHLGFKDFFFLAAAAIALLLLGGAMYFYGGPKHYGSADNSYVSDVVIKNTGTFTCGKTVFHLSVPVDTFTFSQYDDIKPGVIEECFWISPEYVITYMNGTHDLTETDILDMVHATSNDLGLLNQRMIPGGVDVAAYDAGKGMYGTVRFLSSGGDFYTFLMQSQKQKSIDDPAFQTFVNSFH